MVYQLEKLKQEEKELILNAPAYVTLLIAGADHNIEDAEIRKSVQLVHTKSYAENQDIREIYKEIGHDFEDNITRMMMDLPTNRDERQKMLSAKLGMLNDIFTKLDSRFAKQYYKSLRSFATYIANAAGGIFGAHLISGLERKFISLPMIDEPAD